MAVAAFSGISPADRPTLVAAAMVLVLAALTAAFVFASVPAVAGPAGPAPARPVLQHTAVPAAPPACSDITEDSVSPACADQP